MDAHHIASVFSDIGAFDKAGGLTVLGYSVRQWRLRRHDHEEHVLKMRILELGNTAPVPAVTVKLLKATRTRPFTLRGVKKRSGD